MIQVYKDEIKKAKIHVKRGNKLLDTEEYRGAIQEYKQAIAYLSWVEGKTEIYFDNKSFLKTIGLLHTLWMCLGRTYKNLGDQIEAEKCLRKEQSILDLERKCYKSYIEKEGRKKMQNKEFLKEIFLYIGLEFVLLIICMFLLKTLMFPVVYVNFWIILGAGLIYLFHINNFRKKYQLNYDYVNRTLIDIPKKFRKIIVFIIRDLWHILGISFTLLAIILLLPDIITGNIHSSSREAYFHVFLVLFGLFFVETVFFCFMDFYKSKKNMDDKILC